MSSIRPLGPPVHPPGSVYPQFGPPGGPPTMGPPVNSQGPNMGGPLRPTGPPVKPPNMTPRPPSSMPQGPPRPSGPPSQFRPPGGLVNGMSSVKAPVGPPTSFQPPSRPGGPPTPSSSIPPTAFRPPPSSHFNGPPTGPPLGPPAPSLAPPSGPPANSLPLSQPPTSQGPPPPTSLGPHPPTSHNGFPESSQAAPTSNVGNMSNFGRRYPSPSPGPPTIGPPNMGPPSSMGPPTTGPPTMGPPTTGPPTLGPPTTGPPTNGPMGTYPLVNGRQGEGGGGMGPTPNTVNRPPGMADGMQQKPPNSFPPTTGSLAPSLPPTDSGINSRPPMSSRYPPMPPMNTGMPSMPPTASGMPPTTGGMPPMPPMAGGMPPMPPTAGGMPPMPPSVNGRPQGRFGGADTASLSNQLGGLSVTQNGFQKMWGQESVDLLQNRHILPTEKVTPPKPRLQAEQWNNVNCSNDIFRSTLTRIPETEALLKKARLPLGVLIHPFRDLSHLPVIQCTTIVRCRSCRTYINPFVHFVDQRRWRCNLCYRVNELPEEFLYDPVSKSYGDPSRRPECKSSTIEFIAPQEYMLRPPQPAVYLFLLDVSRAALETGYLRTFCDSLIDELDKLPGDGRTQVGFITYHRTLQFYQMGEGSSQATQLIVGDVDDVFLPSPSDLLANLSNCREQIVNMLSDLPELFNGSQETETCLGAALQAAYKMMNPTGGRVTVVLGSLPNIGPGAVMDREGGGDKADMTTLLNPSTDFYKKLALDCSGQQIAVDLFLIASQHCDLATISGISKFSGGQVQTFPGYHSHHNPPQAERFERAVRRYLVRKIGFEAVMRIRCTRGMSLHTFHGHFFVRSTDLLSLPNVNPDTAFGMQVSIEEDLKDSREVSFQAALLYTSSKGERRIRVHTLCLPTTASLQEVIQGADQHCVIGLLSKMAVDRSLNSSLADAREAFINVCVDAIERWKLVQCITQPGVLPSSSALKLIPLLVLAALKSPAFTSRPGVKLDERTASLIQMKCLPLATCVQNLYPDMYRVDSLETAPTREDEEGILVPDPPRLQLSSEKIALNGAYLMDCGDRMILLIGKVVSSFFCEKIFGVSHPSHVDENLTDLPELDNEDSERLRGFLASLNGYKSHALPVRVVRDDSKARHAFISLLADDRAENTFSYYEFLQHLKTQIK